MEYSWVMLYHEIAKTGVTYKGLENEDSEENQRSNALDKRISTLELKMSQSLDSSEKLLKSMEQESLLDFASSHYKAASARLRLKALKTLEKFNLESGVEETDEKWDNIRIFNGNSLHRSLQLGRVSFRSRAQTCQKAQLAS
eukprot:TRINITY_DN4288_c0_g1_i1.p1 TRINITY_DN4288_c0_g1~~TRINITY_DN4288_c0_g1_i1.p1  ORF type:complete len:142 (+),score=39.77 TRINITY_DN4288_c0_g1_i1:173-598(+)